VLHGVSLCRPISSVRVTVLSLTGQQAVCQSFAVTETRMLNRLSIIRIVFQVNMVQEAMDNRGKDDARDHDDRQAAVEGI